MDLTRVSEVSESDLKQQATYHEAWQRLQHD